MKELLVVQKNTRTTYFCMGDYQKKRS